MNDYAILAVDDNKEILDVLDITLSPDYRVYKAQSAHDGLDILSKKEIDLAIVDQRMPGMSGVEFLEKTLEYNPRIVKILLTGYSQNPSHRLRW
ncbi:MAG: response regulator [Deltaproteobacteria bacterium]|nr:response regulator [Deltaproteobacteria bacterium]